MRASEDLLGELHGLVAKKLIERIKSNEATAADFAQALKMLKDNNIAALPTNNNPLGQLIDTLKDKLPFDVADPLIQ